VGKTTIEWADFSFNPWIGCTKVGPGCDHCYAEARMDTRLHRVRWGAGEPRVRTSPANWREPLKWNAECEKAGTRARVFCASLADVFDNEVDPGWRQDLFDLIANTPHLDWLLLTKRIGNAWDMINSALADDGPTWPWPNVWLGATVVNQAEADRDIPKLLAVPAAKRFLSIEPMLGPMDIRFSFADAGVIRCPVCMFFTNDLRHGPCPNDGAILRNDPGIDWVICGSESGHGARACDVAWVRSLQAQCFGAGVPFFWKQHVVNGKKLSLPELDGKSWAELPT